jgi:hypothetical protein
MSVPSGPTGQGRWPTPLSVTTAWTKPLEGVAALAVRVRHGSRKGEGEEVAWVDAARSSPASRAPAVVV